MSFYATAREVLDLQQGIQTVGQAVTYVRAGDAARTVRARVRYVTETELANSIEAYRIEATFDARDFADNAPSKGDSIVVDNVRRGVMQVREVRASGQLIAFKCGVQG